MWVAAAAPAPALVASPIFRGRSAASPRGLAAEAVALPPRLAALTSQRAAASLVAPLAASLVTAAALTRRRGARGRVARKGNIDGEYGVMPETASPEIDMSGADDPIWEQVILSVQSMDQKRGVDISAFWVREGWEVNIVVTALSRPQLQAIANAVEENLRHKLRMKRARNSHKVGGYDIRKEAQAGWVCLSYARMTIHIMTPVQRAYYDIESVWRDSNRDYEAINVEQMLREDTFGTLRLKPQVDDDEDNNIYAPPGLNEQEEAEESSIYEEDEEDPFWA